ncbi:PA2169 family four-helix-bundle protein [Hyphomonas jannaschiana]|uniref:PA2169 family four-helix-bundle protein n=1 Tax=Hyphomonas jannaschiana TaxID=86 RepID=UPI0035C72A5C
MSTDIQTKQIEALNDIAKVLIDSKKGYEKAYEMVDDNFALKPQFLHRAQERGQLVEQFQSQVRHLGGEPQTDGGMLGDAHRGWMQFTSLFQKDQKAALEAIDDGEEYLAEQAEERLQRDDIHGEVRTLLTQAYHSAHDGECFADALTS